jgi:hypothetical protein
MDDVYDLRFERASVSDAKIDQNTKYMFLF